MFSEVINFLINRPRERGIVAHLLWFALWSHCLSSAFSLIFLPFKILHEVMALFIKKP